MLSNYLSKPQSETKFEFVVIDMYIHLKFVSPCIIVQFK